MAEAFKTTGPPRDWRRGMALTLGFIGIVASDLTASRRFYRDLGVGIPAVAADEDHADARLADGTTLAPDTAELIARPAEAGPPWVLNGIVVAPQTIGSPSCPIRSTHPSAQLKRRWVNMRPVNQFALSPQSTTRFPATRPGTLGDAGCCQGQQTPAAVGGLLAGATALDARLLQKLAVLLLRHPLASLLDDRTHWQTSPIPLKLSGKLLALSCLAALPNTTGQSSRRMILLH
jgi:hypothetical protein